MMRVVLNCLLSVLPMPFAALLFGGDFETLTADGPVKALPDLAVPAEYAFIIWFPIFVGWIDYGIYQALPRNRENPLLQDIGWLTIANLIGILLFFVVGRTGPAIFMIPIMVLQFVATGLAFLRVRSFPTLNSFSRWLLLPLLAVNVGWLTAATVLTFNEILPEYGFSILGLDRVPQALFTIAVSTLLAALMVWKGRGYLPYSLTLLWAVAAIIVANTGSERIAVAYGAGVAGLVLLAFTGFVFARQRKGII